MTNLLLKNKTELFKWLSERERERDTGSGQAQTENSEKLQYSFPCFNSKFTELIVNNTPVFFPSM